MPKKTKPPKRPRGRPKTGQPPKRNMTFRLASDVADYLDTVENKARTIEDAMRATKDFSNKARAGLKNG